MATTLGKRGNPRWEKGVSGNPGGRKPGVPNKYAKLKTDWLEAYEKSGGVKLLQRVAKSDPALFLKLGFQLVPREVEASVSGVIEVCWIEDNDSVQAT